MIKNDKRISQSEDRPNKPFIIFSYSVYVLSVYPLNMYSSHTQYKFKLYVESVQSLKFFDADLMGRE